MKYVEVVSQHTITLPNWKTLLERAVSTSFPIIYFIFKRMTKPTEELNLAVLGTQGAGKTTLWRAITQSSECVNPTIGSEVIKEVTVEINGITRTVKQSIDISGGPDKVREEYQELISQKDFIIFIFNIEEFKKSKDVREDVIMRLRLIGRYKETEKPFHIIGSHIDKLAKTPKALGKIKNEIVECIGDKLLKELNCKYSNDLILIDLTEKEVLEKYITETLFEK